VAIWKMKAFIGGGKCCETRNMKPVASCKSIGLLTALPIVPSKANRRSVQLSPGAACRSVMTDIQLRVHVSC